MTNYHSTSTKRPETKRQWAKYYASKGFSVLAMVGKTPLYAFADWPTLTPDEADTVWQVGELKKQDTNVALRTVDFFVIDADRGHKDGVDGVKNLLDYADKHPSWFARDTLTQRTAGGGLQLFFKKPEGVEMTQVIGWLPGVDIKANVNNYVMVPPSDIKGVKYEWVNHEPMREPDKGLLRAIMSQQAPKAPVSLSIPEKYRNKSKSNTAKLFEQIVQGFGDQGGRNDSAAHFVAGLLARDVDIDSIVELANLANQHTPDPLGDKELRNTINSMIKKHERGLNSG